MPKSDEDDSAFIGQLVSDNQEIEVYQQLDAGIRFLQAQARYPGSFMSVTP